MRIRLMWCSNIVLQKRCRTWINNLKLTILVNFNLESGLKSICMDISASSLNFPEFDGELLTDPAELAKVSHNFGQLISRTPLALLKPGSRDDIVKMVQFARCFGIKLVPRGQAHATGEQNQIQDGIIIDMTTLNKVHVLNDHVAVIDAGATWHKLLAHTLTQGLSPPILTDYLDLTIGGTIAVGGIGGQAFSFGAQTDNILELEVVTGTGEKVCCSPTNNAELFNSVRAGLGQFGIVVGARLPLVDVLGKVRTYTLTYTDARTLMTDQLTLINEGNERFNYIEGYAKFDEGRGWYFLLEVAKYFSADQQPDDTFQLSGLSFESGSQMIEDMDYYSFANRLQPRIIFLQQLGLWEIPHPWLSIFIPEQKAVSFIEDLFNTLTIQDVGLSPASVLQLYPLHRQRINTPFLQLPNSQRFFIFSLLRGVTPGSVSAETMVAQNRCLFEKVVALGGKSYPVGSLIMQRQDWKNHFQQGWDNFLQAKSHYDPDNIMTPGQGISLKSI